MKLLDAAGIAFTGTPGISLRLETAGGRHYEPVRCVPLFPITDPDRFISLQLVKGPEIEEIGIIEDAGALADAARQAVREEIRFRYFVPEIIDIAKITARNGLETWQVTTDRGEKRFGVVDKHENIVMTDTGIIFITDLDRLRYKIGDVQKLPPRAQALLDKVLL